MSILLRIEMLIFSILFFFYVARLINRNVLQLRDAISWLFITFGLVIFALFPKFPEGLAHLFGFETTSNFLMLVAIFILLIMEIKHSVTMSKQQKQLKKLMQELAIMKEEREKK